MWVIRLLPAKLGALAGQSIIFMLGLTFDDWNSINQIWLVYLQQCQYAMPWLPHQYLVPFSCITSDLMYTRVFREGSLVAEPWQCHCRWTYVSSQPEYKATYLPSQPHGIWYLEKTSETGWMKTVLFYWLCSDNSEEYGYFTMCTLLIACHSSQHFSRGTVRNSILRVVRNTGCQNH
jgi:hypothetical protein